MSQISTCGRQTRSGPCQQMLRPGENCNRNHIDAATPAPSAASDPDDFLDLEGTSFDDDDLASLLEEGIQDPSAVIDDGWGAAQPPPAAPAMPSAPKPALAPWSNAAPATPTGVAPSLRSTASGNPDSYQTQTDAKRAADEDYKGAAEIVVVEHDGQGTYSYRPASKQSSGRSWISHVRTAEGSWYHFDSPENAARFVKIEQSLSRIQQQFLNVVERVATDDHLESVDIANKLANVLTTLRCERDALMPRLSLGGNG
ncbi:hypothetical protein DVS28_b0537 (plasmid) [Euzebya pacifica]|uniref:Uncharacterized protein n=1 Tax=Euzebya pacifica TaxID=1608957 RepID=A0A346Y730_9ACTN|nr:hypothetical protein [Euzebya pacifica]AXV10277.1 hypothetical protein DVS28_b0537 [Euzebya pacifica]